MFHGACDVLYPQALIKCFQLFIYKLPVVIGDNRPGNSELTYYLLEKIPDLSSGNGGNGLGFYPLCEVIHYD